MIQPSTATACPLCQSTDTRPLFTKAQIPYSACRACGFRFSRPQANANFQPSLDDFEGAYLQYLGSDPADKRNFDAVRGWMSKRTTLDGAKLLDVGCGGGKWVRYLRAAGVDARGIEPSTALFGHFLAKDACFRNTTLDDPALDADGPFDVITAFDVLEHVEDPRAMLRRAASLLKPGGWLFLSLPDAGSFTARLMGRHWHHFNRYHLSFFSRRTLTATGKELGLDASGFCRRGRYRPMGYLFRYLFEFMANRKPPAFLARFDEWYVPLNIFDTMYLAFQNTGSARTHYAEAAPR